MRPVLNLFTGTVLLFAASALTAETPVNRDNLASAMPAGNPVLGNQAAAVRLVEFVSYTCSHCAHYHGEAATTLRSTLVPQGKLAIEVRPFIRNEIDMAASLLALCSSDQRFFANHDAILSAQQQWFRKPTNPNAAEHWNNPDFPARMKAVSEDLGLYRIMLAQGYQPAELDLCLADQNLAISLDTETNKAINETGVTGTPSFLINASLQTAHSWDELRPLLESAAGQVESVVEKP